MADVYMHSRLTEEVLKEIRSDIDKDIAFLGSQGPDPLYYPNDPAYRLVADDIHRYKTQDLLISMTNYVKQHYNKKLYSFYIGFLSHYVLDVFIHPYVYYYTGEYSKDNPETYHMRGLHLKFERSIDCLLIEKELNIPSRKMDLTKKYYPLQEAPTEACELMGYSLKEVFHVEDAFTMYQNSAKAMYKTIKHLVTDRYGIKKQLLKLAGFLSRNHDMILSDLSLFDHLEGYDYHNDAHNTWLHPLTGEEYTTSISDIFQEAKTYLLHTITQVDKYINNEDIDLKQLFPNLSFNTGKDCKLGMNFKYINIYRK